MDIFTEMKRRPEDFKVIERVPFTLATEFPIELDCKAGDEVDLLIADVETTGLDKDDAITELGLTLCHYSPSLGRLTSIIDSKSWYQDPGKPIPEFINKLTGICDDDVRGKVISEDDLSQFLKNNPIVVAHNADFDRKKTEAFIPHWPKDLRWTCSASEIDWYGAGLESRKLEFVLYKLGYFYDGHRATIDTLAVAWVFFKRPDVLQSLLSNMEKRTATIRAYGSPFDVKETLKAKGFKWDDGSNGLAKHWHFKCDESDVEETMAFLNGIYSAKDKANIEYFDATTRFK